MKDQSWRASVACFVSGLTMIFYALTLPGCKSGMPAIDVKSWAGDSAKGGITRSQEQLTISCTEPQFDNFVCLSYDDLRKIYNTLLKCKSWESVATFEQTREFIRSNAEVIHVLSRTPTNASELEPIRP